MAASLIGSQLGRFEILSAIGAGGMGSVYRAYDPDLDRRIAVKVLGTQHETVIEPGSTVNLRDISPELGSASAMGTEVLALGRRGPAKGDLLLEARAMAQLSHPNVVSVFEIGSADGQLFLAMELVEGEDLRAWLKSPRQRGDVIDVFRQAAAGLAAAHRAGLVHRDFKPDNVLIGEDGVVRVADFGLAFSTSKSADDAMVRLGNKAAGTPAYMAPEIFRGAPPSPASDVYGFCVAFVEALGGERPLGALAPEQIDPLVKSLGPLPKKLRRGLCAGLSADPAARPSDAGRLVAIFAPPRRGAVIVVAAAALVIVGGTTIAYGVTRAGSSSCDPAWPRLDAAWNETRAAAVTTNIGSLDSPNAAEAAPRAAAILDRAAKRMQLVRHDVCLAAERQEIDAPVAAARQACLGQRLLALESVVDVLSGKLRADDVSRVVEVAGTTIGVTECATETASATAEAANEELRREFDSLAAALRLVNYADEPKLAQLRGLLPRAEEAGDLGLVAKATLRMAIAERALRRPEDAKRTYQAAIAAAVKAKNDRVVAIAHLGLASIVASNFQEVEEGETLLLLAEAAIARLPQAFDLEADLHIERANLRRIQNRFDDVETECNRALAALDKIAEPRDSARERVLDQLAVLAEWRGDYVEALKSAELFLNSRRKLLGDNHESVAGALSRYGSLLINLERHAEGLAAIDEAIATFERLHALGGNYLNALHRKGIALEFAGRPREALAYYRRVVAARETGDKQARAGLLTSVHHLAQASFELGELDESEKYFAQELEMARRQFGNSHRSVSFALRGLGRIAAQRKDYETALRLFDEGRKVSVEVYGPEHKFTRLYDGEIAGTLVDSGDYRKALAILQGLIAVFADDPAEAGAKADTAFLIGSCLAGLDRHKEALESFKLALAADPGTKDGRGALTRFFMAKSDFALGNKKRALEAAKVALAELTTAESSHRSYVPEIEAWLAAHQ